MLHERRPAPPLFEGTFVGGGTPLPVARPISVPPRSLPLLLVLGACLLAPLAPGQGSVGGYGQGGRGGGGGGFGGSGGFGGGGVGGSMGGRSVDGDEEAAPALRVNPLTDPDRNRVLWTKRAAILTPGVFVEYKIALKRGEALYATATSTAFDAALEVTGPDGKRLAFDDDRAEGDQRPFLNFRAPADAEYRLKVLSFRSAAGGTFELFFRTLSPVPVVPDGGEAKIALAAEETRRPVAAAVTLKKGETVQVRAERQYSVSYAGGRYTEESRGVVGPTGTDAGDLSPLPSVVSSTIFTAERDGDFLLEYDASPNTILAVRAYRVPKSAMGRAGEVPLALAPGRVSLVEFPVEAGSLVTTESVGAGTSYQLQAPADRIPSGAESDALRGQNAAFAFFLYDRTGRDRVLRAFRTAGTVRVLVYSSETTPVTAVLRNEEGLPEWKDGETTPKLGIGEAKLYRLRSKRSELMRVFAQSPTYQTRLDIFTLDGRLANSLADLARKRSADDLYFPKAETYVVRLTSDGFGGSGETVLRRGPIPVLPYALGATVATDLGSSGFALYEVALEAGKRYELLRTSGGYGVSVLDPEGEFLSLPALGFDGTVREYVVPLRTGVHRLWLRGSGAATFRLAPFVTPKLTPPPPGRPAMR